MAKQLKNNLSRYILTALVFFFASYFAVRLAGPIILKGYIETGIGSCEKIPILCAFPAEEITLAENSINTDYIKKLLVYDSPKISALLPPAFNVVQERIKKTYYNRKKRQHTEAVIYLLYEEPNFFPHLFPRLKSAGVTGNYEFLKRTMFARLREIKNLNDAFFVIMKGIFIPGLGEQKNVIMGQFDIAGKKAFINYNLEKADNYFDCNLINESGDFFKIYIKDKGAALTLENVLMILSTVKKGKAE